MTCIEERYKKYIWSNEDSPDFYTYVDRSSATIAE